MEEKKEEKIELELSIEDVKETFSGDIPIYKVKIPAHKLANTPIIDFIIEQRIKRLGIRITFCKECGKEILFLPTTGAKFMPTTLALKSHFADCIVADKFRKPKC